MTSLDAGLKYALNLLKKSIYTEYRMREKLYSKELNKNEVELLYKDINKIELRVELETIHNYIDMEHMILRKGAVSAQEGETLLIPINMRDGCVLARGRGNAEWNYSAPHGAGRVMSRGNARKSLLASKESVRTLVMIQ